MDVEGPLGLETLGAKGALERLDLVGVVVSFVVPGKKG